MSLHPKYILIICLASWAIPARAQIFWGANRGFNIGVVAAIGNKFQRVGFSLQSWYCSGFAQANAEIRVYHHFKNMGPPGTYNELVASAGLLAGYGTPSKDDNPFFSVVGNQTHYRSSIGYAYNFYFNRIKTSQQTGIISLQFNSLSIISENDIFARPILDRFRTGAFLVQYQHKNLYQFAINCTMWTGKMGNSVNTDKAFPFGCYMDTTNGVYTQYSGGLLSGQFKMALANGQNLQANLGVDAEQVRNAVQNRFIHDGMFIPKNWNKAHNCHIPMLDTAGRQYLYHPGQRIKPIELYWNVFSSGSVFY